MHIYIALHIMKHIYAYKLITYVPNVQTCATNSHRICIELPLLLLKQRNSSLITKQKFPSTNVDPIGSFCWPNGFGWLYNGYETDKQQLISVQRVSPIHSHFPASQSRILFGSEHSYNSYSLTVMHNHRVLMSVVLPC